MQAPQEPQAAGQAQLEPAIQAAGHEGAQSGNGVFVKPTNATEIEFYTKITESDSPILEISPTFMGQLEPPNSESKPCVVLEDLLYQYKTPNILDIKLGSILWDSFANAAKVERLQAVANSTTSGSLGFRIAGMSVVQPDGTRKSYDKQYGRQPECTKDTIGQYLLPFFGEINEYTIAVKNVVTQHLEHVLDVLSSTPVEMHSASILIIYEGDAAALRYKVENQDNLSEHESDSEGEGGSKNGIVTVKLIDFGHAFLVDKPYPDLIRGVTNLLREWEAMDLD